MKEKTDFEFYCSDCNAGIDKDDKICPNCGAYLVEEITPTKLTKTRHRILFYMLFPPVIILATWLLDILVDQAYEIFTKEYYWHSLNISSLIMFLVIISTNFLFAFLFINQSNKKRIMISVSISIINLISYFIITLIGIQSLTFTFSLIILFELTFIIFNKTKNYKLLIALLLVFIIFLVSLSVEAYLKHSKQNASHIQVILDINFPQFLENVANNKDEYFHSIINELGTQLKKNPNLDAFDLIQKRFEEENISLNKYFGSIDYNGMSIIAKLRTMAKQALYRDSCVIYNRSKLLGALESSIKIQTPKRLILALILESGNEITSNLSHLLLDSSLVELKFFKDKEETISIMQKIDSVLAIENNKKISYIDTSESLMTEKEFQQRHPFFSIAMFNPIEDDSQCIAEIYVKEVDRNKLNMFLNHPEVKKVIPDNMDFVLSYSPSMWLDGKGVYILNCVNKMPVLKGNFLFDAKAGVEKNDYTPFVNIKMNVKGLNNWSNIRKTNISNKFIIIYDSLAYSSTVLLNQINAERFQISGMPDLEEAMNIENILNAGTLAAPLNIVSQKVL